MSLTRSDTGAIDKIASKLITEERHKHLENAEILHLWHEGKWTEGGEQKLGEVKKASEMHQAIADSEVAFILTINKDWWDEIAEDNNAKKKREALIDELLCQCGGTQDEGWKKVKPNLVGFSDNIARYGAWRDKTDLALREVSQLDIFADAKKLKAVS